MACAHAKFTGEVGVCLATSGPGRDPPAQRPVRRQARPPARGGDRRPAGPPGAGRQLPAGGRPPSPVQGRRARVRADGDRAGADPPPRRSRGPHRHLRADGHVPDLSQRSAGGCRRSRPRPARTAPSTPAPATRAPSVVPARGRSRRAAEVLNEGERVAMLVGAGALHAARRGDRGRGAAGRRRRQGAARQGRAARRSAVRDRLDRPARHEAELGADEWTATRC